MDSSRPSRLTGLQESVLREFFARDSSFFLTGGAALAGYHLRHRPTDDLDLFTTTAEDWTAGRHVLADVAAAAALTAEILRDAPGFVRVLLQGESEAVVVDLVHDRAPQLLPKETLGGVIVDPVEEIAVNKLTTVLSRGEERDLVDLYCLEQAGVDLEAAASRAERKDGGATPASLAWILSEIRIPPDLVLPAEVEGDALEAWREGLVSRLRRLAHP